MANIKSKAKRVLTNKKAELRNKSHKSKLKTVTKKIKSGVEAKDKNVDKLVSQAYKIIDAGVVKSIWHKNNAARKKSAIAKMINKNN